MDEIRRLENQIKELQRELQRQNSEANRMRQNLANENLRKLEQYQSEMQNNLDQHDEDVQREYERLLNEYQRSANEEIQDQQLKMDIEYQKLLMNMQQKEQEWIEKSKQLESLISELKKNGTDKERVSSQEADRYTTEAALAYKEVEKKPHEKFFPKRILTFYDAIREARTLFKSGLNEAAIAISISAKSGLNRLGFEIDDELEQWKMQYNIFKSKVGLLHLKMGDELKNWKNYSQNQSSEVDDNEKEQLHKEIDFWSKAEWSSMNNRLAEFGREIAKIENLGFDEYLKQENSISTDKIREDIEEIDKMIHRYEELSQLYKARFNASCERAEWGEAIIDFLVDEINLVWIEEESHFKLIEQERETAEYISYMNLKYGSNFEKEDIRDWLELVFENPMETCIYIYIVPYEKDVNVENRLVIYIDYEGAENEDYSRQIYNHVKESIRLEEDDGIINFATDVNQLTTNMNTTLRETGKSLEKKIRKKH